LKTEEMLSAFSQVCADVYDQVSTLQYYQGKGPYLIALVTDRKPWEFHLYEIVDAESFLENPRGIPRAFNDPEFFFEVSASLDLSKIQKSGKHFQIQMRKIIPDTPTCRLQVQKLFETNPLLAECIFFMAESGDLLHSKDILPTPTIIH